MMAAIGRLLAVASGEDSDKLQRRVIAHELRISAIERTNRNVEERLTRTEDRLDAVEESLDTK